MQIHGRRKVIERELFKLNSLALSRKHEINICLNASCAAVAQVMGLDDLILYMMDQTEDRLHQVAGVCNKITVDQQVLNPLTIRLGEGIVGSVAASGRPEIVNDTSEDIRYLIDDEYRLSEVAVPIFDGKKMIALLDSEDRRPGRYGECQVVLLSHAGKLMAPRLASVRRQMTKLV